MDDYDRGESATGGVGATEGYGSNLGAAEGDGSDGSATEGDGSDAEATEGDGSDAEATDEDGSDGSAADGASKDLVRYKKQEVDISDNDRLLAEKAYDELSQIYIDHYESAIIKAGEYIIKEFYNGDIEMARAKKSPKERSLNHLTKMIKDSSSKGPSKSWVYNAVNLVVQKHDLNPSKDDEAEKKSFHTYGNLRSSHQVCLLSVSKIEQKKQLIDEIGEKGLTIQQLRVRIRDLKPADDNSATKSLDQIISRPDLLFVEGYSKDAYLDELSNMPPKLLDSLRSKSITQQDNLKKEIADMEELKESKVGYVQGYGLLIEDIAKVIANKAASSQREAEPGS